MLRRRDQAPQAPAGAGGSLLLGLALGWSLSVGGMFLGAAVTFWWLVP
jgi:hypothetical protein